MWWVMVRGEERGESGIRDGKDVVWQLRATAFVEGSDGGRVTTITHRRLTTSIYLLQVHKNLLQVGSIRTVEGDGGEGTRGGKGGEVGRGEGKEG